jgi:hypothetical protein
VTNRRIRSALIGHAADSFGTERSAGRNAASRDLLLIGVGAAVLATLLGLLVAVFPTGAVIKIGVLLAGGVVLLLAFISVRSADGASSGRIARAAVDAWAFLIGVCPIYLPFKFGPLPGLNPTRVSFGVVICAAAFALITSPDLRARLSQRIAGLGWVFKLIVGFMAWLMIASLIADESIASLYAFAKDFLPGLMMLLVVLALYRDRGDIERTAAWLWLGAGVACAIAIYEWRTNSNPFIGLMAIDTDDLIGLDWIVSYRLRGGEYRVSGPFAHPLTFGEYLAMVTPVAIMLAAMARRPWLRLAAAVSVPLFLFVSYLTHTRSSSIALAAGLFAMLTLVGLRAVRRRDRPGLAMLGWFVLVVVLASAVFASGAITNLAQGRTAEEAGSSRARILMFERGAALVADQPLQGYGLGTAAAVIGPMPGHRTLTIDSFFLSLALESGVVGLVLFVSAMSILLVRLAVTSVSAPGGEAWVLMAFATGLAASMITKVVLSLNHNLNLFFWFIGIAGVTIALLRQARPPGSSGETRPAPHRPRG